MALTDSVIFLDLKVSLAPMRTLCSCFSMLSAPPAEDACNVVQYLLN